MFSRQSTKTQKMKISFNGETKRVKLITNYEQLVQQTKKAYSDQKLPQTFKFFYLDDEQEIISINSQYDLDEALSIEDLAGLKLIVATDLQSVKAELEQQFNDAASMRESLMSSQIMSVPLDRLDSNQFEQQVNMMPQTARMPVVSNPFKQASVLDEKKEEIISEPVKKEEPKQAEPEITKIEEPHVKEDEVADFTAQVILEYMNKPLKRADMEEDKEEAEVKCYKCQGSRQNKKGTKPCKKCNGTGAFQSKLLEAALDAMRGEVRTYCANQFRCMLIDRMAAKQAAQAKVVHEKIVCDGCDTGPITGVRYTCSVRHDYDLCEKCEQTQSHEYPLLKIRNPEQAPVKIVCQYRHHSQQQQQPTFCMDRKNFGSAKVLKHSARFIRENFGDQHVVACGETFTKEWTFRNDGEQAWPMQATLIKTNGDDLGAADDKKLERAVEKEQEYTWAVELKAPAKAGRYTAYFRMTDGSGHRFGHKVWCDILAVEKVQAAQKQEQKSADVFAESSDAVSVATAATSVKQPQAPIQQAKKELTYSEKVDSLIENAVKKEAMNLLNSMGFTNFKVNSELFDKYKSVDTVINTLCNEQLSESNFELVKNAIDDDEDLYASGGEEE